MPPVRSTASGRRNKLMSLILSVSKVMPSCSYYIKKGLLCIVIASPSNRQPSSCAKCIKVNIRSSCNVYLVSNAEYKRLITCLSCCMPHLICLRVLDSIYC